MKKYEVFLLDRTEPLFSFESEAESVFTESHPIFFEETEGAKKKIFVIQRVTSELNHKREHVIRLYCWEKKNLNN